MICTNCHINTFQSQGPLKSHQELCFKNQAQLLSVPLKGTVTKFTNFKNMLKCPIKIVADFECYQPKCQCSCSERNKKDCKEKHGDDSLICLDERRKDGERLHGKTTDFTAIHKSSGYGFAVVSEHEEVFKTFYEICTFDGDVAKDFIRRLIEVGDMIDEIPSKEMMFTKEDEKNYRNSNTCWICREEF